jgi:4-diphosphocytidyl-2-C-methyl-D-erythritol kinase
VKLEIIEPSTDSIEVVCDASDVPDGESNLCYAAAAKFAEVAKITPSWRVTITKRIPVAAGLGGGSSDAATTLRLLNDNVHHFGDRDIRDIALSIGADVPFFLDPQPSIGKGLGELLEPVKSDLELKILLVNPRFPVSAAWAYQNLKRQPNLKPESTLENSAMLSALRSGEVELMPKLIRNDLAPALLEKFPLLRILLDELGETEALSRGISGSGPTIFAIFADDDSLQKTAANLAVTYGEALSLFFSS